MALFVLHLFNIDLLRNLRDLLVCFLLPVMEMALSALVGYWDCKLVAGRKIGKYGQVRIVSL